MDDDNRDLIHQLFAFLTERLEEAHEIAVEGHDARRPQERLIGRARCLEATARDIATLSAALSVNANTATDQVRWSRFVGQAGGPAKVYSAVFSRRQNLHLF